MPLRTAEADTFGVLVAIRQSSEDEFIADEERALGQLATQIAPFFSSYVLENERRASRPTPDLRRGTARVFRQEAVEARTRGEIYGDPLEISPSWIRWSYRALVFCLLAGILFIVLAQIDEYASGIAVVRSSGRIDLTATLTGKVAAIEAAPGQEVMAGQVLLRFQDLREAAELQRIAQETKLQLIKRLRDPSDGELESDLFALRAQYNLAQVRVEELKMRAPVAGTVSDIWVRPGQHLLPGQVALSLRQDDAEPYVVALIPGADRPRLRPGMKMRLEIAGFEHAYQWLTLRAVSDDVVSIEEIMRYLGPEVASNLEIDGPVAMVEAELPAPTFEADGDTFHFHDGMRARAEILIDRDHVAYVLLPGLKALRGGDRG